MKYRTIKDYSIFGILNLLVCQWLFFRLVVEVRTASRNITKIGVLYPVIPLTGIWTKYKPIKVYRSWFWHFKL